MKPIGVLIELVKVLADAETRTRELVVLIVDIVIAVTAKTMVSCDSGVLTVRPDVIVGGYWRNSLYEVSDDDEENGDSI